MPQFNISQGRCQFCHAQAEESERIIAGDSAFICEKCVQRCVAVFGASAGGANTTEAADRYVFQRFARHFALAPINEVQATSRNYPLRQQADLQLALDELFGERKVPDNFVGTQHQGRHDAGNFSRLVMRDRGAVEIGLAQYEEIDIGRSEIVRCLRNGVWLRHEQQMPYAVVLSFEGDYQGGGTFSIDVAAPPGESGAG